MTVGDKQHVNWHELAEMVDTNLSKVTEVLRTNPENFENLVVGVKVYLGAMEPETLGGRKVAVWATAGRAIFSVAEFRLKNKKRIEQTPWPGKQKKEVKPAKKKNEEQFSNFLDGTEDGILQADRARMVEIGVHELGMKWEVFFTAVDYQKLEYNFIDTLTDGDKQNIQKLVQDVTDNGTYCILAVTPSNLDVVAFNLVKAVANGSDSMDNQFLGQKVDLAVEVLAYDSLTDTINNSALRIMFGQNNMVTHTGQDKRVYAFRHRVKRYNNGLITTECTFEEDKEWVFKEIQCSMVPDWLSMLVNEDMNEDWSTDIQYIAFPSGAVYNEAFKTKYVKSPWEFGGK